MTKPPEGSGTFRRKYSDNANLQTGRIQERIHSKKSRKSITLKGPSSFEDNKLGKCRRRKRKTTPSFYGSSIRGMEIQRNAPTSYLLNYREERETRDTEEESNQVAGLIGQPRYA